MSGTVYDVAEPIPVDVEVVADPKSFFSWARIRYRLKGSPTYTTLDSELPKIGQLKPAHFNRILAETRASPAAELVGEMVLRSQAQAEYSAGNFGHFGLNLRSARICGLEFLVLVLQPPHLRLNLLHLQHRDLLFQSQRK